MIPLMHNWNLFCLALGMALLLALVMRSIARNFYTKDVVVRRFSIMELEIPATPMELMNLIRGLYALPEDRSGKAVRALRTQLYVDFLFMPFACGSIFLACMGVAAKMQTGMGAAVFVLLAWLQTLACVCNVVENRYLLRKITPDVTASSPRVHKAYLYMETLKWGVALVAIVGVVAAVAYCWLSGNYSSGTPRGLLVVIVEFIVFFVAANMIMKGQKAPEETPQNTGS